MILGDGLGILRRRIGWLGKDGRPEKAATSGYSDSSGVDPEIILMDEIFDET